VKPFIQREASSWEGVFLKGSQITAIRGSQAVTTPVNRGKARGGARKASKSSKASSTAGITKNTQGGGRATRSSQSGNARAA